MNNIKKGILIIFSGPSGVGKRTVIEKLFLDKRLNLKYSISMTTRDKRNEEIQDVDYHFVSKEMFEKNIENHNFLEWAVYVSNKYGTLKSDVDKDLNNGFNVILEIETVGAKNIMKKNIHDISFFLSPPSINELKTRLENRKTESSEIIDKRLEKAILEMKEKDLYEFNIINNQIEIAVEEISNILYERICKNE